MILNDIFKLYFWSLKISREPAPDRGRGRTRGRTVKKLAHSSGKNKKKETLLRSQSGNLISVLPTATLRYPPSRLVVTHTIVIFHLFLFPFFGNPRFHLLNGNFLPHRKINNSHEIIVIHQHVIESCIKKQSVHTPTCNYEKPL